MVSIDFFTVPTITLKAQFVFIVLEDNRREVLHFNVTDHPTAFPADCRGLRRTGNSVLSRAGPGRRLWHRRSVAYRFQIEEILTAPRNPWQNPYAERLMGSIRRDVGTTHHP
jgi:putative transposase